jgi:hypothetical protein
MLTSTTTEEDSVATNSLHGEVGDLIEIGGTHVGETRRTGEILEVLGPSGHEHYRVRWEDGHETLFYPSGHASVVHRVERPEDEPVLKHEAVSRRPR